MPTIQIDSIHFGRNESEGTDGYVYYLVLKPCEERPCRHVCLAHPEREHHYERQAFRLGTFGHRLNATPEEIQKNQANVWGWDGNREAPTLTPSFLGDRREHAGYLIHLFLTGGRIQLCSDSTLVVDPSPASCRDSED